MKIQDLFKEFLANLIEDEKLSLLREVDSSLRLTSYERFGSMDELDEEFSSPSEALSHIKDGCHFSYYDDVWTMDVYGQMESHKKHDFLEEEFDTSQLADNMYEILSSSEGHWRQMFTDWLEDHDDEEIDVAKASYSPEFDIYVSDFETTALSFVYDMQANAYHRCMVTSCQMLSGSQEPKHHTCDYSGRFIVKQEDGSFNQYWVELMITSSDIEEPCLNVVKFC